MMTPAASRQKSRPELRVGRFWRADDGWVKSGEQDLGGLILVSKGMAFLGSVQVLGTAPSFVPAEEILCLDLRQVMLDAALVNKTIQVILWTAIGLRSGLNSLRHTQAMLTPLLATTYEPGENS